MYVLVDFEWIEKEPGRFMPVQLAALRVDSCWQICSTYIRLIRPRISNLEEWDHCAFSGSNSTAFLSAPTAYTVLTDFCSWLCADDILLWWDDAPLHCFEKLLKIIIKRSLPNKCMSIRSGFKHFVNDGIKTSGSVYKLAALRGLDLLEPEHCSSNDVHMLQRLLVHVDFKSEWLYMQPSQKPPVFSTAQDLALPYQLDRASNTVHTKGCSLLASASSIKGAGKIDSFVKSKATPCPECCKNAWKAFLAARNERIMKRSECSFFFLPTGHAFHTAHCHIVLHHIDPPRGVRYFHTAYMKGYVPCKRCKPTVSSNPVPIRKTPKFKSIRPVSAPKIAFKCNISLTASEQHALLRHQQASKERYAVKPTEMDRQTMTDFYTLTATRYAFWAARGYRTFHTRNCPKLNGLKDLTGFARYNDAVHAGRQPCRLCRPSPKQDAVLSIPIYSKSRQEETVEQIIELCKTKGFICTYIHPELTIETAVGRWMVDVEKRPIFVEHQHKDMPPKENDGIHWQPRMFLSLHDLVRYISTHDA